MISRLQKKSPRRATNFSYESAQARLFEVQQAEAEKTTNAIKVHGTPIWYFRKDYHGSATCTCRKHKQRADEPRAISSRTVVAPSSTGNHSATGSENPATTYLDFDMPANTVELDFTSPLAWEHVEAENTEPPTRQRNGNSDLELIVPTGDDLPSLLPETRDATGTVGVDRIFGHSTDCPVCNRTGVVNGFSLLRHDRKVLEHAALTNVHGYSIDQNASPYIFQRELSEDEAYVEFEYFVPKHFYAAHYAVYEGAKRAQSSVTINGVVLTLDSFRSFAGQQVTIRVADIERFTHVVFIVSLTKEQLRGDFPQKSKPHDYGLFRVIDQQTICFDSEVGKPQDGDIVMQLTTHDVWKLSDGEQYAFADEKVLAWSASASLVQPNQSSTLSMVQLFSIG